jgi:autotransporter-associated beta strand protein
MKPTYRNPLLRAFALAATISICLGQAAQAAPRTWTGTDGIWETGVVGGWDDVWAAADTGTFNGAGGIVTLQSAISAGIPLSFASGDYILQSNDTTERIITLGAIGGISQGTGVTTTIGSKATIASAIQWAVDGVNKAGNTFIIEDGGKLSNSAGILTIRETTLNIKTGGILDNNNSTIVGDTTDGAILNVQGGTLSIPATGGGNLILGNLAVASTVNIGITGGAISFTNSGNTGGIRFGPAAQGAGTDLTATFDLDGGTVTTNKIYEGTAGVGSVNSTFNFNGGTLKALKTNTTDFMNGLNAANVKAGGANIDSAAFNILIAQNLLDGGGAGGLTKTGTGALTLSGTNAYTGTTAINEGALTITNTAALPGWDTNGRYSVASGATLAVYNAFSDANIATLLGTTNFAAGASLGFDTTSGNRAYSVAITDTAQGALGLTKLGGNALTLNQLNTYSGPAAVIGTGILTIQNAGSLGTTANGTSVASGARLELDGGITVTGEAATLAGGSSNFFGALQSKTGVNKWTGDITVTANDTRIGAQAGSSMEVSGTIDSGISTHSVTFRPADATATVIVSGNNTYLGATNLVGGLVNASSLNSVVSGSAFSNFGAPTTAANGIINFGAAEGSGLRYTGSGETTDRIINLGGTTQGGRIDQSGTGELKFTSGVTATGNGAKTLTLQGSTAGTGEIAGPIANSTSATSLIKTGTGTWTLSGTNTYTGTTAVTTGTLKLNYDTGAGGTDDTKLSNTAALTLGGATLELVGGSHPEVVLSTTLTAGSFSKLVRSSGGAVLQMNAITRNAGASIDFSTSGIATTDTLNTASGILGTWATVGGSDWATNSTNLADGPVTAYSAYTDLSDSSVIADGSTSNVRINSNGGGGSMTLGSATTTINSLLQNNSSQPAVIDLESTNTLATSAIMIGTSAKGLTVGTVPNDGTLTAATAGGDLLLRNNSITESLTIHSAIADNTSASTLTKVGPGAVVLAGTNTYTGVTSIAEGTLKAGSAGGFSGTSPLVMSGTSILDLNGHGGAFTNLTATAANTITTTGEEAGVDTLTVSALSATSPALFTDNGIRRLALSVAGNSGSPLNNLANTFSGGLSIGSTVRLSVTPGTVGTPGAIVSGPFGRGAITVNGGNTFDQGAQIWFAASNRTLVNDVIVNGNGGMGARGGTFRIGTNSAALTNIAISGNITANLANASFGSDSISDGTALLLSGKLTGNSGFRFFVSANTYKWTTTLNNTTGSPNDYAGNTVVNSATTTLALGAANQIPNGPGKGNVDVTAGTLDLAGFDETINGLIGTGTVGNVATGTSNTLTIGDGDATGTDFTGVIRNTKGTLGLTKIGTGVQTLSGANTYVGATRIDGGTLALGAAGGIANTSSIRIAADAKLKTVLQTIYAMPTAKAVTFGLDAAGDGVSGQIEAAGLDITNAVVDFDITGPLDDEAYILATYTSKIGSEFASVVAPSGYAIDYDYNGGTQIALVQASESAYDVWINGYPSITGDNQLATADPDFDGLTNQQEFAFGLVPNSASSANPILVQLDKTAGQFTYQRLASSGLAYTVWTSDNLVNWTLDSTAIQTVSSAAANETVVVTLSGSKPLSASKLFVRVQAN